MTVLIFHSFLNTTINLQIMNYKYLQNLNIHMESCANSSYRTKQVCISVLKRDADREG